MAEHSSSISVSETSFLAGRSVDKLVFGKSTVGSPHPTKPKAIPIETNKHPNPAIVPALRRMVINQQQQMTEKIPKLGTKKLVSVTLGKGGKEYYFFDPRDSDAIQNKLKKVEVSKQKISEECLISIATRPTFVC